MTDEPDEHDVRVTRLVARGCLGAVFVEEVERARDLGLVDFVRGSWITTEKGRALIEASLP